MKVLRLTNVMNALRPGLAAVSLALLAGGVQADAVSSLRAFVKDVQQAQAQFTQTVTSPDGKKVRKSTGSLAFQRPDRFRFDYKVPIEQLIVGDGRQVWLFDADLNQVTVRPMTQAMGATPAALLSGQSLDKDFVLKAVPPASVAVKPSGAVSVTPTAVQAAGVEWVEATPRVKDGQFQSVRVGFRGGALVALEVLDSFGQRSRMDFSVFDTKVALPPSTFMFTPPAGADVLKQP
ncbi:MAG TPA: outer membrane lipoprotein chaperone LolA [Aquabacterium sp.]|uniref:outer membrane lipoprotein chaperone LolA n=1 Tax=Aquabacterium sp. TaxID=1872578 RepID=UPI002E3419D1|nr:outer membrane lipoprotein chaperone LolA [Aquabacterium sp.]HEX5374436.1 outer membrane lipoprotein chaperone LolA [Aquabacterium sp.]